MSRLSFWLSVALVCCGFGEVRMELAGVVNGQIGDRVKFRVAGLDDDYYRLTLCRSAEECSWADYLAREGVIDPSESVPVNGQYKGLDPAGLVWTSSRDVVVSSSVKKRLNQINFDGISYVGYVEQHGVIMAESALRRGELVTSFEINGARYRGGSARMYWPPAPGEYEVVFVFDGQPPDRSNSFMPWLALQGFIVVYADYWRVSASEGDTCLRGANLDEMFFLVQGMKGLMSGEGRARGYRMKGEKVHLVGASRGGEAARWMAIIAPEYVQTMSVLSGAVYAMPSCGEGDYPWMFRGKPLPAVPVDSVRYRDAISSARLMGEGQATEVEHYFASFPDLDQYWIPASCDIPSMFIYGSKDDRIDGRRLPAEYRKKCGDEDALVFELDAGHPLLVTSWDQVDCKAWDNDRIPCEDHMASVRLMEERLIGFLRSNPAGIVERSSEDVGKCRRSSADALVDSSYCN